MGSEDHVDAALADFFAGWRARIAAGAERLGWKIGINEPAMMRHFGLVRSVVGALTREAQLRSGESVSTSEAAVLAVEPELAIFLRDDVPDGDDSVRAERAVGGVGPALEILDGSRPSGDLAAVLGHNVFHYAVWLGEERPVREGASLDGLAVRISEGDTSRRADAAEALGDLARIVGLVAGHLARHGERLLASDVILSGSLTPAVRLARGSRCIADFGELGRLGVALDEGGRLRALPASEL